MKTNNSSTKLNSYGGHAALLCTAALLLGGCTKGAGITGSSASSVSGTLTVQKVFPTPEGESWTAITSSGRYYLKGLAVTVTGTCTRGIDKIKVRSGSNPDFTEQATCLTDGTWTWTRTFVATTEEGDQTLTFTAYDIGDAEITGSATPADVRVDATAPAAVVVTSPGATPYTHNSSTNPFPVVGTCSADTVKIIGPAGVVITPSGTNWTYDAAIVAAASLNFSFYAYDLAGNSAAGFTQTILWTPSANLLAAGTIPGAVVVDSQTVPTAMSLEGSVNYISGVQQDSGPTWNLFTGFNYIINKARGL